MAADRKKYDRERRARLLALPNEQRPPSLRDDAIRAKVQRKKAAQRERMAADPEYAKSYRARRAAELRAWRERHPDLVRAYDAKYAKRLASPEPHLVRLLSLNSIYAAANGAVPRSMPAHVRDDVISMIVLAVLEGDLRPRDIGAKATTFLTAYHRDHETHKTISTETLIRGTNNLRLIDTLADDTPHF